MKSTDPKGFSPLMNIDKLIPVKEYIVWQLGFSPLMNIDKLIPFR